MKVTINAPNLGQQLTFLSDGGDDTLQAVTVLHPGAFTPLHVHLRQEERFVIREGELEVRIRGERRRFGRGEPRRSPRARLTGFASAIVEAEVTSFPALRTRELFETLFALDRAGALSRAGAPGPLHLGLLAREYGDELFLLARIPAGLQLRVGRVGAGSSSAGWSRPATDCARRWTWRERPRSRARRRRLQPRLLRPRADLRPLPQVAGDALRSHGRETRRWRSLRRR